ncbi:MAG: very short patch repair endonuclease [Bacteroidales bacterium]|nr:very short patch repair endonuclease [Bacteroidales bacterium]
MTDIMTPQQRHYCMSRIRSKDTTPEKRVRQWLWNHGYRYRLCVKGVPGKPDIVMRKYRTAIFVNGCFWHGHGLAWSENPPRPFGAPLPEGGELSDSKCCKIPKTNREFWVAKIYRNQERDQKNYEILFENGWQVIVLWECQLKPKKLEQTMLQVEVQLHDYYLRTFSRKSKTYIHIEEENLPMAAEDPEEYGLNF